MMPTFSLFLWQPVPPLTMKVSLWQLPVFSERTDEIDKTPTHLKAWYIIKWKHFRRYWPFVWGIHRSPVNSPHKGQWRGALMFSLICAWINDWVNNGEAADLRRHCAHYDVTIMVPIRPAKNQKCGNLSHGTFLPWLFRFSLFSLP